MGDTRSTVSLLGRKLGIRALWMRQKWGALWSEAAEHWRGRHAQLHLSSAWFPLSWWFSQSPGVASLRSPGMSSQVCAGHHPSPMLCSCLSHSVTCMLLSQALTPTTAASCHDAMCTCGMATGLLLSSLTLSEDPLMPHALT